MDLAIRLREDHMLRRPSKFRRPVYGRCQGRVPGVVRKTGTGRLHRRSRTKEVLWTKG